VDAHLTRPAGRSTLGRVLAVWLLFLTVGIALLGSTGTRINLSGSPPLGFYRLTAAGIGRGAFVTVCPDPTHPAIQLAHERGYLAPGWGCDGEVAPLLKRVLALPGDQVAVQEDGIQVNGQQIERSARLVADRAGRPMPRPAGGTVPAGQVWVLGDAPASFDSRYFGPVSIPGAAAPLLTRQR